MVGVVVVVCVVDVLWYVVVMVGVVVLVVEIEVLGEGLVYVDVVGVVVVECIGDDDVGIVGVFVVVFGGFGVEV